MSDSRLRVLVVDDERLAREGVRELLEAEPDVTIVGECADGRSTVDALKHGDVDIAFLDVQMPGMGGFEVLEALNGVALPVVVFVTAYDTHAVRAFEASALDYVVKPFSDERLRSALARARRQVHQRRLGQAGTHLAQLVAALRGTEAPAESAAHRWIDRIPVRSVGRVVYVRVSDIVWIGSADYYAQLHTADGKSHLVRDSMQRIEEKLDPARFARVHRTAIVNLDHVVEIRTDAAERQCVVLRSGVKLPLGKSRRDALERSLASR